MRQSHRGVGLSWPHDNGEHRGHCPVKVVDEANGFIENRPLCKSLKSRNKNWWIQTLGGACTKMGTN